MAGRKTFDQVVDVVDNKIDNLSFKKIIGWVLGVVILLFVFVAGLSSFEVVNPGYRGVRVTMGKVDPQYLTEGLNFKPPFVSSIKEVSVKQWTFQVDAECFSSDLQQVNCRIKVLYRVPENKVVTIYKEYQDDVFTTLVAPRVQEAVKEITALNTAEKIVQNRELIKQKTLEEMKSKINGLIDIDDIIIENIGLSKELETAIESKMVQEQEASKSKFKQMQSTIEAETKIITAKGEAEAIKIQGEALKTVPDLINLKIVEKWDGKTPLVVGDTSGANILLPITEEKH